MFSIIIPVHKKENRLQQIRRRLDAATDPIQTLIVLNNPELVDFIHPEREHEHILFSPRKGRGFAFLEGIVYVKGEISFLLHSDIIPPHGWDRAILQTLNDPQIVGGEFSMAFDIPKPHLRVGVKLVDLLFLVLRELYGDRGMFLRTPILMHCLSAMQVPLFEDVQLSKCMRRYGKVVKLPDKIIASTHDFLRHGFFYNIGRFLKCRLWYALGGAPDHIYPAYYRKD